MVTEGHAVNMAGLLMQEEHQGWENIHRQTWHKTDSDNKQNSTDEQENALEL